MASGLPDYQVESKINTGGILQISGSRIIIGADFYPLFTVTNKGIIIGGRVLCDFGASSHKADHFDVLIDGSSMNVSTFELINKWALNKMFSSFLYELRYDDVNFEYCLGFPNGVTFESSFELNYTTSIGSCTVSWQLLYSLYS